MRKIIIHNYLPKRTRVRDAGPFTGPRTEWDCTIIESDGDKVLVTAHGRTRADALADLKKQYPNAKVFSVGGVRLI